MRARLQASLLLAGCLVLPIACGGGGGSPPPGPVVTLTAVAPLVGPASGGTPLTLTGSGFTNDGAGPNSVTIGPNPATTIVTVSDTQITCVSPAGPPGGVSVTVTNSTGSATLAGGFAYTATPAVGSVRPGVGNLTGGTTITVTGSGFLDNMAGTNQVRIGATLATGVAVVSDTVLTCVTPPGPAGPATVTVLNDNGQGTLPAGYTYAPPVLYAADGKGTNGLLYTIDTSTGGATVVGPIGTSVTGLAMSPTGTLYATEAVRWVINGTTPNLLTIDTTTGAGTIVGPLQDGAGTSVNV
ncbi:MAG: IPT/TIG domain-containing protein, partial [Planctomycetota bacterium]